MKRYYIHVPGWVYAGTFYGSTPQQARKACRKWLGVSRLPNGTAVWEA